MSARRRGRRCPRPTGLSYLNARGTAIGEAPVIRARRGVREVRGREEDARKNGPRALERRIAPMASRASIAGSAASFISRRTGNDRAPERASGGRAGAASGARARADERAVGSRTRGRRRVLEAEVDAREDVARVVADDARGVARAREALGQRVEVSRALLPAREHRADAVVMRVAAREQRDPRRERPRERHVGAVEPRPLLGERREVRRDARVEAVGAQRVGGEHEDVRAAGRPRRRGRRDSRQQDSRAGCQQRTPPCVAPSEP